MLRAPAFRESNAITSFDDPRPKPVKALATVVRPLPNAIETILDLAFLPDMGELPADLQMLLTKLD